MKQNKVVVRSVRMTPEVFEFILRMDGKSFNDKFNRMIIWCMTREKVMHEQLKDMENRHKELQLKILKEENFLQQIDQIKVLSEEMYQMVKKN